MRASREIVVLAELLDDAANRAGQKLGDSLTDFHRLIRLCLANPEIVGAVYVFATEEVEHAG